MRWLHLAHVALLLLFVAGAGPVRHPRRITHPAQVHMLTAFVTGYLWSGYRTATGIWPYPGVVATDPAVIPLGSHLRIAGLPGVFLAADTGGAIRGARVDVFCTSLAEAYGLTGWRRVTWWR